MNQNPSVRKLVRCGVVAAIYVVLCMALQPLSYGAVQVRVAEALCLLPVFGAEYIAGVVLGCFLANLLAPPSWMSSLAPLPPCWLPCHLQAAEHPHQGSGCGGFPAAGAVQCRDHRH
mgnify:CR=1 FL=1